MHNNRRLNKQSVILNDGDKIEIGSQSKQPRHEIIRIDTDNFYCDEAFSYVHNGNSGVVGPATQEIRLDNAVI